MLNRIERQVTRSVRYFLALAMVAGLLGGFSGSRPAFAADPVIARVDGIAIHKSELAIAAREIGGDIARVPQAERARALLRYIIETRLLAGAAMREKLDQRSEFKTIERYFRLKALRDIYLKIRAGDAISDAKAREIYDQRVRDTKDEIEVAASHILVESEKEALEIAADLKNGSDFADLARQKSQGPSGVEGGKLGYFTKGRMVPEFSDVAFSLKIGEISRPIKTQFGWHVIKVTDRRKRKLPDFEKIKSKIKAPLIEEKAGELMSSLFGKTKIEILDPALKGMNVRGSY